MCTSFYLTSRGACEQAGQLLDLPFVDGAIKGPAAPQLVMEPAPAQGSWFPCLSCSQLSPRPRAVSYQHLSQIWRLFRHGIPRKPLLPNLQGPTCHFTLGWNFLGCGLSLMMRQRHPGQDFLVQCSNRTIRGLNTLAPFHC